VLRYDEPTSPTRRRASRRKPDVPGKCRAGVTTGATPMKMLKMLPFALLCGVLLPGGAKADDVPNFKKVGDLQKKFVSEVCVAVVKAARTSAKNPSLHRYEYKDIKPGRKEL